MIQTTESIRGLSGAALVLVSDEHRCTGAMQLYPLTLTFPNHTKIRKVGGCGGAPDSMQCATGISSRTLPLRRSLARVWEQRSQKLEDLLTTCRRILPVNAISQCCHLFRFTSGSSGRFATKLLCLLVSIDVTKFDWTAYPIIASL